MNRRWGVLACVVVPLMVLAQEPERPAETATEAWLKVQASNRQASPVPQVQTDKERDQAMQRWLDSYKYAIPDFYRWTKVNSSNN
ncbi:DUF3613 domain-containing protein [Pseudomonas sp. SWRI51]|uniref:DUF3613 domain-containing protein n=1 Tax=Pseudomonas sp. SWRI51 TaxID=2745491 RepID=UPI0016497095|nr:DUF3613 domain-containing protein [Pseudomonas sp. SWRI51]MBC3412063.1 DUF3613 domain-containing protein [Pseudomonas sp. SWRI51]